MLSDKYFGSAQRGSVDAGFGGGRGGFGDGTGGAGWSAPAGTQTYDPTATRTGTMTMGGVASATALMLAFLVLGAIFGWSRVTTELLGYDVATGNPVYQDSLPMGWLIGSMAVGFVLAMICSFKPPVARWLSIPYAIAEGVFLGIVSHAYNSQTDGIVVQAVIATCGVFLVMLALYGFRVLRVTPRLAKGIIAATFGVLAVYLVSFISSFFTDSGESFMNSASPLGIGVSVIVVGIAAFNLLLDFDFIERGVQQGLPKHMEWFGAFGLVVTLVWLYLELLRLLSKLQRD